MRRKLLPLFFVLLLAIVIVPVRGDTIISLPTTGGSGFQCWIGGCAVTDGNAWIAGECFTMPSSAFLSSVTFLMKQTGTPTYSLTGTIRASTGTAGSTCKDTGSDLATSTNAVTTLPTVYTMTTFSFAGTFPLSSGTVYVAMIHFGCISTCDSGDTVTLEFSSSDIYAAGNAVDRSCCPAAANAEATQDASGFTLTGIPSSVGGQTSQCAGDCGSTLNTNSTHGINFNASVTIFIATQSNLNGFARNVTAGIAKPYSNGMTVFLGLYTVDLACTATGQPFTPQCPGFLQAQGNFRNPSKGLLPLQMSVAVFSGEWLGVAVSASFSGLDLNDTSTSSTFYQTAGIMPGVITQYTSLGSKSSQLFTTITGFTPGSGNAGGSGFTSGGGCITCGLSDFINALGGGTFGGIIAFGIIFALVAGGLLYATRIHHPKSEGGGVKGYGVPMELLTVIFVIMLIGFSAAGALPPWIPFLVIALVAWLFTQSIFGHRRGTSTEPV